MNNLFSSATETKNKVTTLIVLITALQLIGCATTVEKDVNQNMLQQALVLQEVKPPVQKKSTIEWQFSAPQIQPNKNQKHELFLWFSTLTDYSANPILLQLGPDWISSYKRGNALREMIPRGIVIQQKYNDQLPEHTVIFSLKNKQFSINNKQYSINNKEGS